MRIGVKVLEGQVAAVADAVEGVDDGGPVGGAVQQRAKRFQRMIGSLLGEFLEVHVLDAVAEDIDPVFGELEEHDIARVEMDANELALEAVDETRSSRRGSTGSR